MTKFHMLNFRTQGEITLSESQRLNKRTGKPEMIKSLLTV